MTQNILYLFIIIGLLFIMGYSQKILFLFRKEIAILKKTIHLPLDEEQFKSLVSGGSLYINKKGLNFRIYLDEMEFDKMKDALREAEEGLAIYEDHHKVEE